MIHLRSFFKEWFDSLKRYPGTYLMALLIAIVGMRTNHITNGNYNGDLTWGRYEDLENILMCLWVSGLFALPLMIVWPLMRQIKSSLSQHYAIIWQALALLFWLLFYLCLPQDFDSMFGSKQAWMMLSLIFAWFMPLVWIVYAARDQKLIWWWTQQFVFRLVIGVISAAIVGWGISASLFSIENLFDVVIDSQVYVDVWIAAFALLGASVWLTHLRDIPEERDYNKLFRFFWLYIFLPLAGLYALILLTYALQIAFTGVLPRGIISRMVIGYTAFGMAWYLLTYPLRGDFGWLRKVHMAYFISLLLFVILLFIAIGLRIDQYGLTTERYLVTIFGIWIVVISWISLLKPSYSLSAIVVAFVIWLFVSAYGPQSASNLPQTTQYNKLVSLLETNEFLQDGHIVPHEVKLEVNDMYRLTWDIDRIYKTASYLGQEQGPEVFKPLYAWTGFEQLSWTTSRTVAEQFMVSLGVDNKFANAIWGQGEPAGSINYYVDSINYPVDVSGYSLFVPVSPAVSINASTGMSVAYSGENKTIITISLANKTIIIDLQDHLEYIRGVAQVWFNDITKRPLLEINWSDYKLILTQFSAERITDGYKVYGYAWYVFIK